MATTIITSIPVRYVACDGGRAMVQATFNTQACPASGRVVVNAAVGGGWVFCGTERDESDPQPGVADNMYTGMWLGEYLRVSGAVVELLEGDDGETWSGDESVGTLALTHDGSASEIVVVYGTRAD